MKKLWETELKNSIDGGVSPTIDPFSTDEFYIADGWCSMYNSMRLRRISFISGKETANVLVRNMVKYIYFSVDGNFIFVVTNNKILKINRKNLKIEEKFDKNIPKYMDYFQSDEAGNLVMMNHVGKSVFVFNCMENKLVQKKVTKNDWCCNILKEDNNNYLIFSPKTGTVQRYSIAENKLETILKTQVFAHGTKDQKGNFYFQSGEFKKGGMCTDSLNPLSQIFIISAEKQQKTYDFEFIFKEIRLSSDEKSLFLIGDNKIWQFSLEKETIISEIIAPKGSSIIEFFEEKQFLLAIAHQSDNKKMIGVTIR
ncbi:hypothetical protein CAPN001_13200 [Capnocytophaga stomatis]|uniref:hypothetical protein n=1 Tax=Capnocytophaga stomatis TaxID=1848904 RepID=UPI001950780C|nr:hypothetical protein [Capnocytophaga stomatis]GIJ96751.1 hypothetical protein CAPN001_13200 [Capnocytophaga stomatis]